jgi:hypothetical protein
MVVKIRLAGHTRPWLYEDGGYRGGDYFGKMPEFAMRKRPGGYKPAVSEEIWKHSDEYWECLECSSR